MPLADGSWSVGVAGDAWSGFLPAIYWRLYQHTADTAWRDRARAQQAALDAQATRTATSGMNDLGFILQGHLRGAELDTVTRRATYTATLTTAAQTLSRLTTDTPPGRFHAAAACFETLDPTAAQPGVRVNIDMMGSLELLWWVARYGSNASTAATARARAVAHADKTLLQHFRSIGLVDSVYAVVEFDRTTGALVSKTAGPGFDPATLSPAQPLENAAWARGQAYALLGYALAARYTGKATYLAAAQRVAGFIASHLPGDKVPFWDYFYTPAAPSDKDSTAAAVNALGFLEIAALLRSSNAALANTYTTLGGAILASLASSYLSSSAVNHPSTLIHAVARHAQADQIDRGTTLGDAYVLAAAALADAGAADTIPPEAPRSLTATAHDTSIDLAWEPGVDSGSGVKDYRVYQGTGASAVLVATVTGLSAGVSGLTIATAYHFEVETRDNAGNVSTSRATLDTATSPDTTNPTDPPAPVGGTVTPSSVQLSVSGSTDNVGVRLYRIWRGPGTNNAANTLIGTVDAAGAGPYTFTDTSVAASTAYTYRAQAEDFAGNRSAKSAALNLTTPAPIDTTPPSDVATPTAGTLASDAVPISWTAATDDIGVDAYLIWRGPGSSDPANTLIATVAGNVLTYTDTSVQPSTPYTYRLQARDAAGNVSVAKSGPLNVTTPAGPSPIDTTPPTNVGQPVLDAKAHDHVDVSWPEAIDDTAVTAYLVYRGLGTNAATSLLATVAGDVVAYRDTAVSAATAYTYQVAARDAAGNVSVAKSPNLNVTTDPTPPIDTTAPTVPTHLAYQIV